MTRNEVQATILDYLYSRRDHFTAPYGILDGEYTNPNGRKCLMVTFGKARTLDATVMIYGEKFIVIRTSRHGQEVHKTLDSAMDFLKTL